MGDSGIELIEQWLQASPFVGQLGITVDKLDDGLAVLTLPFRQEHTTIADVVHGGALSSLIDTAATAAAWAGADASGGHFRMCNSNVGSAKLTFDVPAGKYGAITYDFATSPQRSSPSSSRVMPDAVSRTARAMSTRRSDRSGAL